VTKGSELALTKMAVAAREVKIERVKQIITVYRFVMKERHVKTEMVK